MKYFSINYPCNSNVERQFSVVTVFFFTKLWNTLAPNSLDKLMQLILMEPHIYDFDRNKINHLDKPHSVVLTWCNLTICIKIFELKIYCNSLFGHAFWAHVTWWQDFATFIIRVFSLPLFLNAKSLIFVVCFVEKPPELIKDLKGSPFTK